MDSFGIYRKFIEKNLGKITNFNHACKKLNDFYMKFRPGNVVNIECPSRKEKNVIITKISISRKIDSSEVIIIVSSGNRYDITISKEIYGLNCWVNMLSIEKIKNKKVKE